MTQITLAQYWMGRDGTNPFDLSTQIRKNAEVLLALVNKLIAVAEADGVQFHINPVRKSNLTSGWRPPSVNATTKGAAVNSLHMTGQAVDVYDPDGDFDEWLMSDRGQQAMKDLGIWHEHPAATKGWTHLQSKPPKSGRRTFYP